MLNFYNKTLNASGWQYPTPNVAGSSEQLVVNAPTSTTLSVRLLRGNDVLATYTSPQFPSFSIPDVEAPTSDGNWKFAFAFRLQQPSALNRDRDWLAHAGRDVRASAPPGTLFTAFNENLDIDPDAYGATVSTSTAVRNFLLYRAAGTALASTRSANNDAPLFELPRRPYLSLGELQHLYFPGQRPFAIGNPWGAELNGWFDRYFFSGVGPAGGGPATERGQALPNWNLVVRPPDDVPREDFDLEAWRDGGNALSSRHLLAAGGFNLHSTSARAWQAVLSGVRFSSTRPFRRAFVDDNDPANSYTGSQPAASPPTINETLNDTTLDESGAVGGPSFFRFPQSAQETYFWSNSPIEGLLGKQSFRQGVRGGNETIGGSTWQQLTTTQVAALANAIVANLRAKVAGTGPFVSLEEFLGPAAALGGQSLLEKSISDANLNPDALGLDPVPDVLDPGFGSLTLTPADIMTALGPMLRTRSDTFLVRTFGEVINPATGDVEGRAWGEALVQRVVGTVDSADDIAAPSATGFGRKYKVLRFRWLGEDEV